MIYSGQLPPEEYKASPNPALAPEYMQHQVLSVLDRAGMLKQGMQSQQEEARDLPAAQLANTNQAAYGAGGMLPTQSQAMDPQDPGVRAAAYVDGNRQETAQVMGLKAQGAAHYASTQPVQAATDQLRSKQYLANNLLGHPELEAALGRNTGALAAVARRMG